MDLSLQQMRYACALAKHLHFGKAAKDQNTSQPNLSVQIKKIEFELNTPLFERSNKQVLLTTQGQRVINTFQSILGMLDVLESDCSGETITTLNVGIFPTLAPYLLPKILPAIKQAIPELSLYIVEEKTATIVERLKAGTLDCILAAHPIDTHMLDYDHVLEDTFYLAVSTENPLSQKEHVSLSDLESEHVMLLEEGHCLRDQALDVCYTDQITIDKSYESSSLETLRAMVAANTGVTFIPGLARDRNKLIQYRSFDKPFSRKICLYWRQSTTHRPLFKTLAKLIQEKASRHNPDS